MSTVTATQHRSNAHIGGLPNEGIHPKPVSSTKRAKWRQKWLANRARRAALNAEYKGEKSWNQPGAYFEALKGLSLGTAT